MIDEKKLIEEIRVIGIYGSGYSDSEREENVIACTCLNLKCDCMQRKINIGSLLNTCMYYDG